MSRSVCLLVRLVAVAGQLAFIAYLAYCAAVAMPEDAGARLGLVGTVALVGLALGCNLSHCLRAPEQW